MTRLSERDNQTEGYLMNPKGEIFGWAEGGSSHLDTLLKKSEKYKKLFDQYESIVGEGKASQTIVDLAKKEGWVRAGMLDDVDGRTLYMETGSVDSIKQFLTIAGQPEIDSLKYITDAGRKKIKVPEGYIGNLGDLI